MEAYNDCRAGSLSARSWPPRSLSHEHSNNLFNIFMSKDRGADFEPFEKSRFIIIGTYAEMRRNVAELQMEIAATDLKKCLC